MEKVEAANKVAVESGHRLLSLLGQPQDEEVVSRNLIAQTNESLYKFKKVVSLLDMNRFAAAKARRMKTLTIPNLPKCLFLESYPNPTQNPSTQITHNIFDEIDTRLSLKPPQTHRHFHHQQEKMKSEGPTHTVSSTVSSLSLEGSVTGQNNQDLGRRRCTLNDENGSLKCVSAGKCHCSKKRFKRSIKVPAISNKMADIPTDEFVWRKYGQKPIKGSPHPRAYYKCSTVRGCPARKHVERCAEEPSMMLVNYEGEHVHPRYITIEALPIMGHQPGTNC